MWSSFLFFIIKKWLPICFFQNLFFFLDIFILSKKIFKHAIFSFFCCTFMEKSSSFTSKILRGLSQKPCNQSHCKVSKHWKWKVKLAIDFDICLFESLSKRALSRKTQRNVVDRTIKMMLIRGWFHDVSLCVVLWCRSFHPLWLYCSIVVL